MDDLVTFLRARLDEDALWAVEASRKEGLDQPPEGGVHWRWVPDDSNDDLTPVPSSEQTLGEEAGTAFVSLCSREEWTSPSSDGPVPQYILHTEEVPSAAAGHIIRHDPARILAELDAKRRIVDLCAPPLVEVTDLHSTGREFIQGEGAPWGEPVLRLLALPYADHPDYQNDWRH